MLLSVTEGSNHPCAGPARFVCDFVRCSAAAGWSRSSTRSSAITCEHLDRRLRRRRHGSGRRSLRGLREMGAIEQRKEECRDARGARARRQPSPGRDITRCARFARAPDLPQSRSCRSPSASARIRPSSRSSMPSSFDRCRIQARTGWSILREQPLGAARHGQRPSAELRRVARPRALVRGARAACRRRRSTSIGTNGAEQIARIQTTSELFRVFGVGPAVGPRVHGRGDSTGRTTMSYSRPRLLAAVVWRRPRRPRTKAGRAGRLAHDRRRRAAGTSNRRRWSLTRTRRCPSIPANPGQSGRARSSATDG